MMSSLPLLAITGASIVGSLHCAGMCGPLACAATMPRTTGLTIARRAINPLEPLARIVPYHAARILAYVLLGTAAGTLGSAVDLAGRLAGLQRFAAITAALALIGLGLRHLLHRSVVAPPTRPALASWWSRAMAWPAPLRAATMGLLTALLPCGWLWLFLVTAAGTASPTDGALSMLAFGLGTIPALLLVSLGASRLAAPLVARVPTLAGLLIITAGFVTLWTRTPALATPHTPDASTQAASLPSCCHGD